MIQRYLGAARHSRRKQYRRRTVLSAFMAGLLLWLGLHHALPSQAHEQVIAKLALHQNSAHPTGFLTESPVQGKKPFNVLHAGVQDANQDSPSSLELILATDQAQNATLPEVQQGLTLYNNGDFAGAAQAWTKAIQILDATHQPVATAVTLNYLALAQQQLGQFDASQASVSSALKQIDSQTKEPSVRAALARLLNTQGSLYLAVGKAEAALEQWQRATATYRQLKDSVGELGSLMNQAQAEQALGYFLRARNTLTQAEAQIPQQADVSLRVTLALNLGQVLTHIGEFERAQTVLAAAQALAQANGFSGQAAIILIQQGNLAYAQQQWTAALAAYQQAITLSDRSQTQVEANLNALRVFDAQGRWSEVQTQWPTLKKELDTLPSSHKVLLMRLQLADTLIDLRMATQQPELLAIAQILSQARHQARQLQDLRLESYTVGYLAQLYESAQQWSAAEKTTRRAIALAIEAQSEDSCYRWKWQLGRILRAQGQTEQALRAYQEAVDILQKLRLSLVSISAELQYSFRDQVEPVYREYADLLLQPSSGKTLSPDTLKTAQRVIESLRIAELSYFLRSSCLESQQRILESVLQPGTALLYPIVLPDRLAILMNLPDGSLHLFQKNISPLQLEDRVQRLRVALEKPYTAPEGKAIGFELYRWLVEPVEPLLSDQYVKTLVMVPDGVLRDVPFAALHDGQRFLIERYRLALMPSLQLALPQPSPRDSMKVLAAGLSESRAGFAPLSFVPDELKAVVQAIPGKMLLNRQFTTRAIANAISEPSITTLHLATHGQFSSTIDRTFVLAWDKPITLYDLRDLIEKRRQPSQKAIDLLVLSACETAAGDRRATLGLAGVAAQSGTRSTVATLWNIDDESSGVFMKYFYDAIAKPGTSKAEALQAAQLMLLQDPDYRHPFHWAAYVLVGSWR